MLWMLDFCSHWLSLLFFLVFAFRHLRLFFSFVAYYRRLIATATCCQRSALLIYSFVRLYVSGRCSLLLLLQAAGNHHLISALLELQSWVTLQLSELTSRRSRHFRRAIPSLPSADTSICQPNTTVLSAICSDETHIIFNTNRHQYSYSHQYEVLSYKINRQINIMCLYKFSYLVLSLVNYIMYIVYNIE